MRFSSKLNYAFLHFNGQFSLKLCSIIAVGSKHLHYKNKSKTKM